MATIQGIYIALFGRPADPAGLAFFNAETNNGADLTAIGDLAATDEYQDRFTGLSNAEIINSIYQSLFGRDGEQEGIDFFVAALEDGTYNINNIAIAILDGAQGDDLATVNAKIAAANIFTAALDQDFEVDAYSGPDAAALARDFIDTVTIDDAGTQEEADAVIANIVNQGGGAPVPPGGDITNTAPESGADAFTMDEDTVLNGSVAGNDTDADGDILSFAVDTGPSNGTLVLNADGTFTYEPNTNYFGSDSFTYKAFDGITEGASTTVTITVDDVPDGKTLNLEPFSSINESFNVATDRLTIDNNDVSDTWGAGPDLASFTATPNGAFNDGLFTGADGITTATNAVIEFNNDFSAAFSGTINSNDLLNALRQDFFVELSAPGIDVGLDGWDGYLVAYADNNAYVFYGNDGGNGNLGASEIGLVATLTGVAVGSLTQANFISGDLVV